MRTINSTRAVFVEFILLGIVMLILSCSQNKNKEEECVDPPESEKKTKIVTRDRIRINRGIDKSKADWCRTCVMGPKGWASCQVVYADSDSESRDAVKARSREKACDDAGFKKGVCPEKAVIGVSCKGDKSSDKQAKAVKDVFFPNKKGSKASKDATKASADKKNAPAPSKKANPTSVTTGKPDSKKDTK